jgi:SAM-dependent methyltransferase
MLMWMEDLATAAQLHGTDIDAEAIAWCRARIPYATFDLNDSDPPLPYPDGAFDLVFNRSVFTHLDERRQDLWLTELQRVTRTGGLIVLSTHGEHAVPEGAWKLRDAMEQDGIVFVDETIPREFGYPDWYQNTWHAPWYVFEHWGRWFNIRAYLPGGALGTQDQILLERRADDGTPRLPLAARPSLRADGAPARRVADVLAAARSSRPSGLGASSRLGSLGAYGRWLVLRAMRPYTFHQDDFDDAVATSIAELTRATDHHTAVLEALQRQRDGPSQ